ncbi:hypothetical protein EDD16DRAFT_1690398 [Pisolithus croceorrhizus]|nr:hypothetical protein EDD16DRAFT_1690398 [Pisolithus croceorrhizus]
MAKGAAKRIAGQNERAIKNLRLGMVIPTILSLVLRLLLRRDSLPPSKGSLLIYVLTYLPLSFDLNQPGVTEWSFDVLYVTWACQVGREHSGSGFGILSGGECLHELSSGVVVSGLTDTVIRALQSLDGLVGPFLWPSSSVPPQDDTKKAETSSKRQEKLRKRSERGDQRVRAARK